MSSVRRHGLDAMAALELHEAASSGDYDALEEYIRSGNYDPNTKDEEWKNKTALHWAASKGYVDCMRLLLENGANGTSRMTMGWTPAHCAAESGKVAALRALHTAKVHVNLTDKYGDTPRRVAEIYGHLPCVTFLQQAELEIAERMQKSGEKIEEVSKWSDEEGDEEEEEGKAARRDKSDQIDTSNSHSDMSPKCKNSND